MRPLVYILSLLFLMCLLPYSASAQTKEAPNTSTKILSEIITGLRKSPSHRKKALDAKTKSTLRNLMTAEEVYFIDHERYVSCNDTSCTEGMPSFQLPEDITVAVTAKKDSYSATAARKDGTGKHFSFDTDKGLIQESRP